MKIPGDGVPGVSNKHVVEVVTCIYGLVDAPRTLWVCFSNTLKSLGMVQSQLDPCILYWNHSGIFYWYHSGVLEGVFGCMWMTRLLGVAG